MSQIELMNQQLGEYLKTRFPERRDLYVGTINRRAEGFSYETYIITLRWKEGKSELSQDLVIRMEPVFGLVPPYDVKPQYEVLKRLYGTRVPVPKVLWLETDSRILGRPFFIMEKIEGEILDTYYPQHPEEKEALLNRYVDGIAEIHALDWCSLGLSLLGVPAHNRQHAEETISRWEKVMEESRYGPQPVIGELLSWLKGNIPQAERTTLYHGDAKTTNFFIRDGQVAAVLDWELTGIGDPVSDLGWACSLVDQTEFFTREEFIRLYEEKTGINVSRNSLLFWEVLSHVEIMAISLASLKAGLELKEPDARLIMVYTLCTEACQNTAARLLGF